MSTSFLKPLKITAAKAELAVNFSRGGMLAAVSALLAVWLPASTAQAQTGGRPDMLINAGFESGMEGWAFTSHHKRGIATIDKEVKRSGDASLRIENTAGEDSFMKQEIKVKPKTRYRLSGYIKTKDVAVKGGQAATLALEGGFESTDSVKGTNSWRKFDFEFDSGALDTIRVGPRLGGHSSAAMGTAWYDDLKLIELGPSRNR